MSEKIAQFLLEVVREHRNDFALRPEGYLALNNGSGAIVVIQKFEDKSYFIAELDLLHATRKLEIPEDTLLGQTIGDLFAFLKAKQEDEQEMNDAKFIDKFRKALN